MTATLTDEKFDTVVQDVVDLDIKCEATVPCDRRAEWKVRVTCCKNLWLLCQECVDEVIEHVVKFPDHYVTCGKCRAFLTIKKFVGTIYRL